MSNNLIVAAAGSGKTTHLVNEALKIADEKVLITTFTEANENEIRKKFYDLKGYIPNNITFQTWFSFLIQNGLKKSCIFTVQIAPESIGPDKTVHVFPCIFRYIVGIRLNIFQVSFYIMAGKDLAISFPLTS